MTFTLTTAAKAGYNVKMATGAKIVDKNFLTIQFSVIMNGDTIRVYGPAVDGVITASVVRKAGYDLKAMK